MFPLSPAIKVLFMILKPELDFKDWTSITDINIITNWISYNFENETEIKNFVDELYLNYQKRQITQKETSPMEPKRS